MQDSTGYESFSELSSESSFAVGQGQPQNGQILPCFAGPAPWQEGLREASPRALEAVCDARRQLFRHVGSRPWARGGWFRSATLCKNAYVSLRSASKLSYPHVGASLSLSASHCLAAIFRGIFSRRPACSAGPRITKVCIFCDSYTPTAPAAGCCEGADSFLSTSHGRAICYLVADCKEVLL